MSQDSLMCLVPAPTHGSHTWKNAPKPSPPLRTKDRSSSSRPSLARPLDLAGTTLPGPARGRSFSFAPMACPGPLDFKPRREGRQGRRGEKAGFATDS